MAFNTFLIIVVIILLAERITYSRTLLRQIFSKSMTKWLKNYSTNKKSFWGWLIMLIVFGLFGFWCPIFYNGLNDRPLNIGSIVLQGSLSTFSIVVLIEGILVDRTLPKGQRANFLISSVAISLVALHILVYGFTISGTKTSIIKYMVCILSLGALIIAILLYQYKKVEPEETAEELVEKEKEEIQKASNAPSTLNPII